VPVPDFLAPWRLDTLAPSDCDSARRTPGGCVVGWLPGAGGRSSGLVESWRVRAASCRRCAAERPGPDRLPPPAVCCLLASCCCLLSAAVERPGPDRLLPACSLAAGELLRCCLLIATAACCLLAGDWYELLPAGLGFRIFVLLIADLLPLFL
jgi:hypothetical protein